MSADPTHDLLAELGWLRTLARRLVRDPNRADDLVQDACAVALNQSQPPRSWRAWLLTVLPNLARNQRQRDAARLRRETAVTPPGSTKDTLDVLQRAEAQQRLAAVVLQLDEPYRATVLLRFFDGLPPRAIAKHQGVPVATVHSRLQRAMQMLRARLDHDFAGRPQWLAAFAPFAWPSYFAPVATGLLVMQTKLKVLLAAAAIACSAPLWWPSATTSSEPVPRGVAERSDPRRRSDAGGEGAVASPQQSGAERRAVATAPPPAPTGPQLRTVSGRVCDHRGLALADVPIGLAESAQEQVRSAADGAFTFALAAERAELAAVGDRFVTVLTGTWSTTATIPPVVVVADAVAIGGRVVDDSGAPVAASEVVLQPPDDFHSRFPMPLDRARLGRWSSRTGPDGSFALGRLPRIDGATLLATADAFAPTTVPQPATDDANLQIVLRRFHFAGGELRGRVLDPAGAPAKGARVAMGVTSVVTDDDGTFALSLQRAGWPTALIAAKAGYLPARLDIPRQGGTDPADWPAAIVLRLGGPPRSVRGRVVDQNQVPVAKAEVWLADPTPLGIAAVLPLQVEYLIAGGPVPPQAARMRVPFADEPTRGDNFMDQASNVPFPTASWFWVTTDENGSFELPGLLDRAYTLKALDPTTGLFGEAADVVGDTYREITIQRDTWPELRGRVVSRRGEPIAGVEVRQSVLAFLSQARIPGGRFEGRALREGHRTTTGPDGTFVLRDVGRQHSSFALSGDAIVPTSVKAAQIADPLHCTWTVEARCHVEVVLPDPVEADTVACVDANGEQLDLAVLRHNSNQFVTDLPLHDGKSGLFVVGERAAKLVLSKGDQIVRTIPFTPDSKRTTTLQ